MAMENNQTRESFAAASDLSAKKFHLVRLSSAEYCDQASNPGGTDNLGVLQSAPQSGEHATVALLGMCKVVAGSSMAAGSLFTTSGSGRAVNVSSGGYVYGQVLEASSFDGDIVTVWLNRPWKFAG